MHVYCSPWMEKKPGFQYNYVPSFECPGCRQHRRYDPIFGPYVVEDDLFMKTQLRLTPAPYFFGEQYRNNGPWSKLNLMMYSSKLFEAYTNISKYNYNYAPFIFAVV